jgi:hypothetical protein
MCRLCGEDLESSSHLLFECPTLMAQRQYFLGHTETLDPSKIPVQTLLKFITFLSDTMENAHNEIADKDHLHDEDDH